MIDRILMELYDYDKIIKYGETILENAINYYKGDDNYD